MSLLYFWSASFLLCLGGRRSITGFKNFSRFNNRPPKSLWETSVSGFGSSVTGFRLGVGVGSTIFGQGFWGSHFGQVGVGGQTTAGCLAALHSASSIRIASQLFTCFSSMICFASAILEFIYSVVSVSVLLAITIVLSKVSRLAYWTFFQVTSLCR